MGMEVKSAETSNDNIFLPGGTSKSLTISTNSELFLTACPFFPFTELRIFDKCLAQPSDTLPIPETIGRSGM